MHACRYDTARPAEFPSFKPKFECRFAGIAAQKLNAENHFMARPITPLMKRLSHFDNKGEAHMVDVGGKQVTLRVAVAGGRIEMQPETLRVIVEGAISKGDVLGIARIAAIQAAKRTADLIPLAHPLALTRVTIDFQVDPLVSCISIEARVECHGRTGVEMEALAAASIGLLTIYDMCKAIDRGMVVREVMLLEKRGGKSGVFLRKPQLSGAKKPGRARA